MPSLSCWIIIVWDFKESFVEIKDMIEMNKDTIQDVDEYEKNERKSEKEKTHTNKESYSLQKLVQWNRTATLLLLKIYNDHLEEFISPHTKKKKVWEKVASILNTKYQLGVTALQCENKLKNLSLSYKKAVDINRKRTHFKNSFLFKQMEELYKREKQIIQSLPNLTSRKLTSTSIQEHFLDNLPFPGTGNERKLNKILPWESVLEGIERQHVEKMAKYDKIIKLLEKIMNKN